MQHYDDNLKWIREAGAQNLVVGSQARILYSDAQVHANRPVHGMHFRAFCVPCWVLMVTPWPCCA
jgi:predicted short-subunit dehydrogenase-like oxidoreductase (DUF2520 family)